MNDVTPEDLARGRRLKIGAYAAPILLTLAPAILTILAWFLTFGGPPVAFVVLFVGLIATAVGFLAGLTVSAILARRYSVWRREMRELIAADGIKAEEIDWFRRELRPNEKRALKAVEARDLMLADAYRETLASRLTASRIVNSSRQELQLAKKRQNSLRQLKSARSNEFQTEIAKDIEKIGKINDEAKVMLNEAVARLQMIEAATSRSGILADNELALKKLNARASELPLALESAKMTEEIKKELEAADDKAEAIN